MKFKIDKARANRQAEIARDVIVRQYDGKIPKNDMVCIVTATKEDEEAKKVSYGFRFEHRKNKPFVGQTVMNEYLNVTKIVEIIE